MEIKCLSRPRVNYQAEYCFVTNLQKRKNSPFETVEPHKVLDHNCWTIKSWKLMNYTWVDIETMCLEWITQVAMTERIREGRIIGQPIINIGANKK